MKDYVKPLTIFCIPSHTMGIINNYISCTYFYEIIVQDVEKITSLLYYVLRITNRNIF